MREVNHNLIDTAATRLANPELHDEAYRLLSKMFSASDDDSKLQYLEELSNVLNKTDEEIIGTLQKINNENKLQKLRGSNVSR